MAPPPLPYCSTVPSAPIETQIQYYFIFKQWRNVGFFFPPASGVTIDPADPVLQGAPKFHLGDGRGTKNLRWFKNSDLTTVDGPKNYRGLYKNPDSATVDGQKKF